MAADSYWSWFLHHRVRRNGTQQNDEGLAAIARRFDVSRRRL